MKSTTVSKIIPLIERTSPILLQCKSGACGTCYSGTGKLLWVPANTNNYITFNFRYRFYNPSEQSTSEIRYNYTQSSIYTYANPPDKTYLVGNDAFQASPSIVPSQMNPTQTVTLNIFSSGSWFFFRQPNPAIGNVHDALCFEYNDENKLITFRGFGN